MLKISGRILAHSLTAIVVLFFVATLSRFLGVGENMSIGFGIVAALAPGAYDYLGRDLSGRRVEESDPLGEVDAPWMWIGNTRFNRSISDNLNDGDIAYALRVAPTEVVSLFAITTVKEWRRLDPSSDLAGSVIEALDAEIDSIPDWTPDQQLPMYGLFLADLREGLLNELGAEYRAQQVSSRLQ